MKVANDKKGSVARNQRDPPRKCELKLKKEMSLLSEHSALPVAEKSNEAHSLCRVFYIKEKDTRGKIRPICLERYYMPLQILYPIRSPPLRTLFYITQSMDLGPLICRSACEHITLCRDCRVCTLYMLYTRDQWSTADEKSKHLIRSAFDAHKTYIPILLGSRES